MTGQIYSMPFANNEMNTITTAVTVVIPLYNKQNEILRALNSVFNQTVIPDEVIVVDDGSTDRSAELAMSAFDNDLCLIKKKNCGVSSARNIGIQRARNEYVCLLDADDEWLPGHLEEIVSLIRLCPEAAFYSTRVVYQDEYGNTVASAIGVKSDFKGYIADFPATFNKGYGLVSSSSVCIRKSLHSPPALVFPVGVEKGEDIYYWLILGMKGSLAFSAKPLVKIFLDARNRSFVNKGQLPEHIKWFFSNKELIDSHPLKKSIHRFIYKNAIIAAYGLALERDKQSVRMIIKEFYKNNNFRYLVLIPALFLPPGVLSVIRTVRRNIRS